MIRALVPLALLLAACGGGDSTPVTPEALAAKIGCSDFEKETGQGELGSREQGYCMVGDERLSIHTYQSNETRDKIQAFAEQIGGGGISVLGDRFAIRVDTQSMAERVQGAVGGEIR